MGPSMDTVVGIGTGTVVGAGSAPKIKDLNADHIFNYLQLFSEQSRNDL
jgi:hypothetical protein